MNTSATVTATITPGIPSEVQNLVITVGNGSIYTGGAFVTPSPIILNLGTVEALGASNVDASIGYTFTTDGNQNLDENLSIPFNMSIAVKAIATP